MGKLLQILVAIDQLLNTLLGGYADETISARAYRQQHKARWNAVRRVVDGFFALFGSLEHCKNAYTAEVLRRQSPPAEREAAQAGQ